MYTFIWPAYGAGNETARAEVFMSLAEAWNRFSKLTMVELPEHIVEIPAIGPNTPVKANIVDWTVFACRCRMVVEKAA